MELRTVHSLGSLPFWLSVMGEELTWFYQHGENGGKGGGILVIAYCFQFIGVCAHSHCDVHGSESCCVS